MTDITEIPPWEQPAPDKPKRKWIKPKPKAKEPEVSPYDGIQNDRCPYACKPHRCVITHESICGKPGLQPKYAQDQGCIKRWHEARLYLAKKKADARFKKEMMEK
jgi:hypothetical protein